MPSAFAPGKCILFGEHAVVFGHPAVAVAIDQGVHRGMARAKEGTQRQSRWNYACTDVLGFLDARIGYVRSSNCELLL